MKKRILKIIALCLGVTLTIGTCAFANALVGNPISKMLAEGTAKKHVAASYPNTGYTVESVSYSFKTGEYYALVNNPSNVDEHFSLTLSMLGKLLDDDYTFRVEEHQNVANRIYFEYRALVDAVLTSYAYPYSVSLGYGDFLIADEHEFSPENALKRSELKNGEAYNVGELGGKSAMLVLYIDSDAVTTQRAAEVLLKTKELMNRSGVYFYAVHLVVQYSPYDEQKPYARPEGRVDLLNFLASDIYEDGITARIEDCAKSTQDYYSRLEKNR